MRYNIFYQVHKGLRAMLFETAIAIQQTDFVNPDETERCIGQVKSVVEIFDKHAHTEDNFVFTAIQSFEPSIVAVFEKEHEKDHELGERLQKSLESLQDTTTENEKLIAGQSLYISFIGFMVFNLEHMAKEEDIINKFLWTYYSDQQLMAITQQIVSNMPPDSMSVFSKWMIRGLSNQEIIHWLKEVKYNAPVFIFEALLQTAASELSGSRLQLIESALSEGAMLA